MTAEAGTDITRKLVKDIEFHLTLASLPNCHTQQKMLRHLFDLFYLKYRANILFVVYMRDCGVQHKRIFDYIKSGNLLKAQTALSVHIKEAKKHIVRNLRQRHERRKLSYFSTLSAEMEKLITFLNERSQRRIISRRFGYV